MATKGEYWLNRDSMSMKRSRETATQISQGIIGHIKIIFPGGNWQGYKGGRRYLLACIEGQSQVGMSDAIRDEVIFQLEEFYGTTI